MSHSDIGDAPATTAHDADVARAAAPRGEKTLTGFAVTINRPRQELYGFWRDFENLATFMENIESITTAGDKTSHWAVKAPAGKTVEWDAVLTEDRPDELIAWESAPDADVRNSGRVEFRDGGARGTVVTATIAYDPPGGKIGELAAKLFGREPAMQVRRELRRFKMLMETGEIANSTSSRAEPHKY